MVAYFLLFRSVDITNDCSFVLIYASIYITAY